MYVRLQIFSTKYMQVAMMHFDSVLRVTASDRWTVDTVRAAMNDFGGLH